MVLKFRSQAAEEREREVKHTADEALTLVTGCLEEGFGSKLRLVDVWKIWW